METGQLEAARALGFSYPPAMRLVVIPQGVRRVLPALVNQFIALIKDSSLVYFLGPARQPAGPVPDRSGRRANTGNESAAAAGRPVLPGLTVPLTHVVNASTRRLRTGRRGDASTTTTTT